MGLKEKLSGTGSSVKSHLENVKKDSKYIKEILQSDKVVYLKTEAIAILIRKTGNEASFAEAFDSVTKEGYRMMLQEKITDPVPGLDLKIAFIYYFQHKKYISN